MSELRLSIAVCTFNRSGYLRDTLDDFKKQITPVQQFEILIINNNSTDDTVAVCNNFIKKNPGVNIRLHTETKQGLSHARNRAIL